MRVAIYSRASTRDKGQDVKNQAYQLREFCRRNGWDIVYEYSDRISGKTTKRPQFQKMLADAAQGRFNLVLVWALDRMTHVSVAGTFVHIKRLLSHGVQFVSFTEEHFRTTGHAGEPMTAVAGWIAKQEAVLLSERTRAGLERARRAGKTLGRPRSIVDRYGVRDLRSQGYSLREISEQLSVSKTTVARAARMAGWGVGVDNTSE